MFVSELINCISIYETVGVVSDVEPLTTMGSDSQLSLGDMTFQRTTRPATIPRRLAVGASA
ncbi:hypothetical protein HSR121_1272 [Halapricum desulfuricans]|uniref:Uncharacterized protein n=1 Tax=Halapricum desulfuricans TaxID=2841257 RepID=A0A897N036_9EURY|nr:hypothetical protein HSR121_1272 [Halapricum desulfuricans]